MKFRVPSSSKTRPRWRGERVLGDEVDERLRVWEEGEGKRLVLGSVEEEMERWEWCEGVWRWVFVMFDSGNRAVGRFWNEMLCVDFLMSMYRALLMVEVTVRDGGKDG